jgi:hypothetical protein
VLKYNSKGEEVFNLIDFVRLSIFGEEVQNFQKHGFASLNALTEGKMYPYDDLETFMYIVDYLISGINPHYESLEEEIECKENLSIYSSGIAEMIIYLRELRQIDPDVMDGAMYHPHETVDKIEDIYSKIIDQMTELFATFNVIKSIKGTSLKTSEKKLLEKVMADMATSRQFGEMKETDDFNTYALKIVNCVMYGCRYAEGEQNLIDSFLGFTS